MDYRSKDIFKYGEVSGLMYSCGFIDEEVGKPLIGVINAYSEIVPGHLNLRTLTDSVKTGIRMAGGVPVEFPCVSLCDGIATGRYQMASRNMIADSIELCVESHLLDGMVLLSGCDKIVPGQLMAMARLNIPALLVTSGPMQPGCHEGKHFTLSEYVAKRMDHMLGKISLSPKELNNLRAEAFPSIGSCQGMYTANSMAVFAEALGVTLPRCATIHAVDSRKLETAKLSGMRIVSMVEEDLRPNTIMTESAFKNAMQVGLAIGASTNLCTHIPAIANQAGIKISIDDFDSLSRKTPQLCDMSPAGEYVMLDVDRAGGVGAIIKELSPLLDLKTITVTGKTMEEVISDVEVSNREVIRPLENPVAEEGGLVALRGSLAPDGAIARPTSFPPSCFEFEGTARCFPNAEDATLAVLGGQINNEDIVIVRYEGLQGGPGAREISLLPYMINSLGHEKVGLITDGRLSGSNKGAIICHVTPEAYVGGPLALVNDGDKIEINIPERRLDLLVSDQELQNRKQSWQQPRHENLHNYLKRYISEVNTLHEGALQEKK